MTAAHRALAALLYLLPEEQLEAAVRRLAGDGAGALASFDAGSELDPAPERIDGSLLEAIAARALGGARGAVFTERPEAAILAALGLTRVAVRRGVPEREALAALAGSSAPTRRLRDALQGVRVVDPCCGAAALLVAALAVARRCGFEPRLLGGDVSPLAARAASARLALLDCKAEIACADALDGPWPDADLVLSNPPFVRHEALAPADKARAASASGLSLQADLSAHLATMALRHAPDAALVWPRALETSRSAEPLLAEARARGGFTYRLRSRCAGSFAASIDTALVVWSRGCEGRHACEAKVALHQLSPDDVVSLASTAPRSRRLRTVDEIRTGAGAARVGEVCEVRFGMKSGCNGFFHLRPAGTGVLASAMAGEVRLAGGDTQPLLFSLKEATAPELASPTRRLFRPAHLTGSAAAYVAAGEALGVASRATCAARSPWWLVAPGRSPAPVLYPAKIGARAFAVLNERGWWEDKKWHALFPRPPLEPWLLALVLSATPIRLAVDRAARQLTGMQAIADVDCRVLAAAPFPGLPAVAASARALAACREVLARDPVTSDVAAMLARPAQQELDAIVGHGLGLSPPEIATARRAMVERVAARLDHALHVRAAIARAASS